MKYARDAFLQVFLQIVFALMASHWAVFAGLPRRMIFMPSGFDRKTDLVLKASFFVWQMLLLLVFSVEAFSSVLNPVRGMFVTCSFQVRSMFVSMETNKKRTWKVDGRCQKKGCCAMFLLLAQSLPDAPQRNARHTLKHWPALAELLARLLRDFVGG